MFKTNLKQRNSKLCGIFVVSFMNLVSQTQLKIFSQELNLVLKQQLLQNLYNFLYTNISISNKITYPHNKTKNSMKPFLTVIKLINDNQGIKSIYSSQKSYWNDFIGWSRIPNIWICSSWNIRWKYPRNSYRSLNWKKNP